MKNPSWVRQAAASCWHIPLGFGTQKHPHEQQHGSAIQFSSAQNHGPTVDPQVKFLSSVHKSSPPQQTPSPLPHLPSSTRESNEKKAKAGQTSIDTHPARAPKGKTSRKPGYRSSPLSIQPRPRRPATAAFAGRARVKKRISL